MSVQWPLCFKYTGSIVGTGFVAHIDLCGRVLAEQSDEGVWFYGVTPAAAAACGDGIPEAGEEYKNTLTRVFLDFVQQSPSFDGFEALVRKFYEEGDDERADWDAAIERMRATKEAGPEGLRHCKDPEFYLTVTKKTHEQLTPDDNSTMADVEPALAA